VGQVLLPWCDCETGTLESKKSVLLKIYGSNPVLKNSQIVSVPIPPYNTLLAARKKYFSNTEKPSQIKERLSPPRILLGLNRIRHRNALKLHTK
jgi:hypothetical protein